MTPFAKLLFNNAAARNNIHIIDFLLKAVCYDVSSVVRLIHETRVTLFSRSEIRELPQALRPKTFGGERAVKYPYVLDQPVSTVEHGGLFVFPTQREMFLDSGRVYGKYQGSFLFLDENVVNMIFFKEGSQNTVGSISFDENTLAVIQNQKGGDVVAAEFVAAAIILLNAPYGIDNETVAPHRGFAKKQKARGLPSPKPYRIIKLSKSARLDQIVSGGGTPKAFHFVRSHARKYESGLTTKVKAHWRGDPALGILKTDYRVVP